MATRAQANGVRPWCLGRRWVPQAPPGPGGQPVGGLKLKQAHTSDGRWTAARGHSCSSTPQPAIAAETHQRPPRRSAPQHPMPAPASCGPAAAWSGTQHCRGRRPGGSVAGPRSRLWGRYSSRSMSAWPVAAGVGQATRRSGSSRSARPCPSTAATPRPTWSPSCGSRSDRTTSTSPGSPRCSTRAARSRGPVRVPAGMVEQPLHPIGSGVAGLLGQLPAVLRSAPLSRPCRNPLARRRTSNAPSRVANRYDKWPSSSATAGSGPEPRSPCSASLRGSRSGQTTAAKAAVD